MIILSTEVVKCEMFTLELNRTYGIKCKGKLFSPDENPAGVENNMNEAELGPKLFSLLKSCPLENNE